MALTPKQERFARLFVQLDNASEAYRRAYDCEDNWQYARKEASALLTRPDIAGTIAEMKAELKARHDGVMDALVNYWFAILTFDPTEIVQYRHGACQHCYGENHLKQWRMPDYLKAVRIAEASGKPMPDIEGGVGYDRTKPPHPHCPSCNGMGIGYQWIADSRKLSEAAKAGFVSIKETRNGIEVTVADKGAAASALSKLFGLDKSTLAVKTDVADAATKLAPGVDPNDAARIYSGIIGHA